jgi:uncharacterized membrane protein HdeD (DUF308 family)
MPNFDDADAGRYAPTGPPPLTSHWDVLDDLANHWGIVLGYGVASTALGIVLAVWPDQTLVVVAVLVAIQLIVSGVLRLAVAVTAHGMDGGLRALMGITGALGLIVGLLCLRDPVQTLLAISVLLGIWWVLSGVVDILGALLSPVPGRRGWDAAMGGVSILAGGFLLIDPRLTLTVLVIVVCTWLIALGLLAIVAGLRLRAARRHPATPLHRGQGPATGAWTTG